jgi:hypothetical protein
MTPLTRRSPGSLITGKCHSSWYPFSRLHRKTEH